jgi:NAD(P) transhydrogenase subunit alpha
MKIAVLKETANYEHRVAISPETVKKFVEMGFNVCIEKDAGVTAAISDAEYVAAGARVSSVPLELLADANILLKVQPGNIDTKNDLNEFKLLPEHAIVIGMLAPYDNKQAIETYNNKKISCFAMEFVPRITRAQTMDVLSSQSNLAGYKAVIEGANEFGKIFPMLMTAAGTISPTRVLVLGAGVAGLQAIATAKRLGAIVSAFDVRAAAKEQVESLGASFIEVTSSDNLETTGGYAKETSDEYRNKQQALIGEALKKIDIVICTALIPGKKAPQLITEEMLANIKPGSVIVDLATASGGNCARSEKDKIITHEGIKIIGHSNMPARVANDASKLYAKNLYNFISLLYDKETQKISINLEDEIIKNSLITHNGEIVNNLVKENYNHG